MAECPYYRIRSYEPRIREMSQEPLPPARVELEWCEHPKHSPVSYGQAIGLGEGKMLTCRGSRKNCPLSLEQFQDLA